MASLEDAVSPPVVSEPPPQPEQLRRSRRSTLSFEDAMAQKRASLEAPGERTPEPKPDAKFKRAKLKGSDSSPAVGAVLSPPSLVHPDGRKRLLYEGIFENLDGLAEPPAEPSKNLEWYCSHIDPRVVLWSSHPEVSASFRIACFRITLFSLPRLALGISQACVMCRRLSLLSFLDPSLYFSSYLRSLLSVLWRVLVVCLAVASEVPLCLSHFASIARSCLLRLRTSLRTKKK
jgi:hypothetical protein